MKSNPESEAKKSAPKQGPKSLLEKIPMLKPALLFFGSVLLFMLTSMIYLNNAFDNQMIVQGDMEQVKAMTWEAKQYKETHGHNPGWSSKIFGGMPGNLVSGSGKASGNLLYELRPLELFGIQGTPFNFLFVAMLSMFVLLLTTGAKYWLSAAGAIGYAFMTFSISSYEAGHITKVLAMGAMPGILAGLILLTQRKYWLGAGVLALFFGTTVMYFHYQVVYYAGIISIIYMLCLLVYSILQKDLIHFGKVALLSIVATGIGLMANYTKLRDTSEYAKKTMRGGAENIAAGSSKSAESNKTSKNGLNVDYAFGWSYGISESLSTFIPGSKGGSSNERYDGERYPMYHGDLTFTSGPIYIGAVFIAMFIIGMVVVVMLPYATDSEKKTKRMAVTIMVFAFLTTLISYILAWGRYASINNWFFEHLPYYNKFRTPMMALSIAQLTIPFFGIYAIGLYAKYREKINTRSFLIASGACLGIAMVVAAIVLGSDDFMGLGDQQMSAEGRSMIRGLRKDLAWGDYRRTFMLVIASLGLVILYSRKIINSLVLGIGFLLLIPIDMISVSNRYLTEENWAEKTDVPDMQPTQNDLTLAKINTKQARVYDLRYDPFNSNNANMWHRNIGGYHPAKLSRYQELIANCFTPSGGQLSSDFIYKNPALDMMNCRYVLMRSEDRNAKSPDQVMERPSACGNAWFVSKIAEVESAPDAINKIKTFVPAEEAIFETKLNEKKGKPSSSNYSKDSSSKIEQTYFSPDTINYVSKNKSNGFGVFSEVYYDEAIGSWHASVDGKEVPVYQVDYLLRGIEIPAGEHNIKFTYVVKDFGKKNVIELIFSFIAVFGIIIILLIAISGKTKLSKPIAHELLDN